MKLSNLATSLLIVLGLAATAHAQWITLPLPDTPRTQDGKPNLSAPAPRSSDGHPDLSGIWISGRQGTNPQDAGGGKILRGDHQVRRRGRSVRALSARRRSEPHAPAPHQDRPNPESHPDAV